MATGAVIVRIGASLLVLAAMPLVAGCTRLDGITTESAEEGAVRETIAGFYDATERGDGRRACAALTQPSRRELETMHLPPESPARPCDRAIVEEFGGIAAGRITEVRVEDDTAIVTLTELTTSEGDTGSAELIKTAGTWKVDSY